MPQSLRIALVEGDRFQHLDDAARRCEESAGTTVDFVRRPLAELLTSIEDEGPLHLLNSHSRYTADLAERLLPLDELLSPDELAEFDPVALDRCRWEGRLYQLPLSLDSRLLFYRSDIFDDERERRWFSDAADGRELRLPQGWDELAAIAQHFTRLGKMHGFVFPGSGPGIVALFAEILASAGGSLLDDQGRPHLFTRAAEWALTLMRDLCVRWSAVPEDTPQCGEDEASSTFRLGRAAMIVDYADTGRLLADPTFSSVAGWFGVAMVPGGPDGRRHAWSGSPTLAIPHDCPDVPAALELLRGMSSAETQLVAAKHGALPTRTAVCEEVREALRPGTIAHLRFTLSEQTERIAALEPPAVRGFLAAETALASVLSQALAGELEVVPALERAQAAVAEILSPST
jgi:multiple sugar transport system substrate-binding protein